MDAKQFFRRLSRTVATLPLTVAIGLAAILISGTNHLPLVLQFDRSKITDGQVWRIATCHLTHWGVNHLQWDLLMFVVVGAACESRSRQHMWFCVAGAGGAVSLLVLIFFPAIDLYRGLSGIDTALFTLLAVDLIRDARYQHRPLIAGAVSGLLLGFVAKTVYEAVTGHAFFVDQTSAGFQLLVWDHVVAGVVGVLIGLTFGSQDGQRITPLFERAPRHADAVRSL
jgi:rhomboid family GlyGly-CTERM serine protease